MLDRQSKADSLYHIIVGAKILGANQVDEAAETARKMHITLDRAIVMLKHATESSLKTALEADELVKRGRIGTEVAVQALTWARNNECSIHDALQTMGIELDAPPPPPVQTNDVTEFMIECEVITKEQLRSALAKASETQMPLARAVVFCRFTSRRNVIDSMMLLRLVKDNKIPREDAVRSMRTALYKRYSVWQHLFENAIYSEVSGQSLKLGELLAMAQVISESDLMDCYEQELLENTPLTKLLIDGKYLEMPVLDGALTLLDMVASYLKPFQAADALRQVKLKNISVYQALAELDPPAQLPPKQLRVGDLLVESGVAKREVVEKIVEEGDRPVRVGKKMLDAKLINETMLYNVLRSQSLYKEGVLSADNTVALLRMCVKTTLGVDEALNQMGWSVPVRMQWSWT